MSDEGRLACPECGHRQVAGERCASCGYADGLLSLDNATHVDLLRDIDEARVHRFDTRSRIVAVVIAMVLVFALWCVPGFWRAEQRVALPFLADQWALMIVIGIGLTLVFKRMRPAPRFPYVK